MALPLIPIFTLLGRSLSIALRRWQGIVALTALVFGAGFTFNSMINQMGQTALNLWPLLAMAGFFLLAKEVVRAWMKVKQQQYKIGRNRES